MVESSQDIVEFYESNDFNNLDQLGRMNTQELNDLLEVSSQTSQKSELGTALDFDPVTIMNNISPTYLQFNEISTVQFDNHYQPHALQSVNHLRELPVLDEFTNDYEFDMDMKNESNSKSSSWLYSAQLNKVFVKMNASLNVFPRFRNLQPDNELYIRAMIVFTSQNDLPEPVKKCPNHKESSALNPHHILICENPGVIYLGTENGIHFDDKLAVLIPMKNIASNQPLKMKFTCQNSCSGGMNRKSTSLIFTLEDGAQNILGRRLMHFKVCSCPRRDKDKDESATKMPLPKKRKLDSSSAPSTSKRIHLVSKQESSESLTSEVATTVENISGTIVSIKQEQEAQCELKIVLPSEHLKREALKAVYNVVAGEMTRTENSALNAYLIEIQKQIGK